MRGRGLLLLFHRWQLTPALPGPPSTPKSTIPQPINPNNVMETKPSNAFIAASWVALLAGMVTYNAGLWNAQMPLYRKGYYFTLLMYGLFSAVSLQKSVRDQIKGHSRNAPVLRPGLVLHAAHRAAARRPVARRPHAERKRLLRHVLYPQPVCRHCRAEKHPRQQAGKHLNIHACPGGLRP